MFGDLWKGTLNALTARVFTHMDLKDNVKTESPRKFNIYLMGKEMDQK